MPVVTNIKIERLKIIEFYTMKTIAHVFTFTLLVCSMYQPVVKKMPKYLTSKFVL